MVQMRMLLPISLSEYHTYLDYVKNLSIDKMNEKQIQKYLPLCYKKINNKKIILTHAGFTPSKEIEKLSQHFDSSSIFENNKKAKETDNTNIVLEESENKNLPIERKNVFRRFIDFIKSKIFEN